MPPRVLSVGYSRFSIISIPSDVQRRLIRKLRPLLGKLEAQFRLGAHQPLDGLLGILAVVGDGRDAKKRALLRVHGGFLQLRPRVQMLAIGKLSVGWERMWLGVPKFDTSRRAAVSGGLSGRWPIDLGDEWRLVPVEEVLDSRDTRHKRARKVRKRRGADDHQQGNAVARNGIAFVRLVADAPIVGERDPAAFADRLQPCLVRRVVRKMIRVSLDRQSAGS